MPTTYTKLSATGAARLIAAAAAIPLVAGQVCAQPMTGQALRQSIPGAVINLDTPLGSVVPISYAPDGTLEGKAGAVAFYLGSEKDRGKWWIEGSAVCHKWNTWFNGSKKCLTVHMKPGNRLAWSDQDGGTGTATIVALGSPDRNPDQSSPKAVATLIPSEPTALLPPTTPPAQPPARLGAAPLVEAKPKVTQPPAPVRPAAAAPKAEAKVEKAKPQPIAQPTAMPSVTPQLSSVGPAANRPAFRVVNVAQDDVLNVRRNPDASADVVATIQPNAEAVRLMGDCSGEWCPVQSDRGIGWVHRYFIAPASATAPKAPASAQNSVGNPITYRVVGVPAADVLNIRREADGESEVVATIPPNGSRIRLTGFCRREWCPVTHGRNTGWVNRLYLTLEF